MESLVYKCQPLDYQVINVLKKRFTGEVEPLYRVLKNMALGKGIDLTPKIRTALDEHFSYRFGDGDPEFKAGESPTSTILGYIQKVFYRRNEETDAEIDARVARNLAPQHVATTSQLEREDVPGPSAIELAPGSTPMYVGEEMDVEELPVSAQMMRIEEAGPTRYSKEPMTEEEAQARAKQLNEINPEIDSDVVTYRQQLERRFGQIIDRLDDLPETFHSPLNPDPEAIENPREIVRKEIERLAAERPGLLEKYADNPVELLDDFKVISRTRVPPLLAVRDPSGLTSFDIIGSPQKGISGIVQRAPFVNELKKTKAQLPYPNTPYIEQGFVRVHVPTGRELEASLPMLTEKMLYRQRRQGVNVENPTLKDIAQAFFGGLSTLRAKGYKFPDLDHLFETNEMSFDPQFQEVLGYPGIEWMDTPIYQHPETGVPVLLGDILEEVTTPVMVNTSEGRKIQHLIRQFIPYSGVMKEDVQEAVKALMVVDRIVSKLAEKATMINDKINGLEHGLRYAGVTEKEIRQIGFDRPRALYPNVIVGRMSQLLTQRIALGKVERAIEKNLREVKLIDENLRREALDYSAIPIANWLSPKVKEAFLAVQEADQLYGIERGQEERIGAENLSSLVYEQSTGVEAAYINPHFQSNYQWVKALETLKNEQFEQETGRQAPVNKQEVKDLAKEIDRWELENQEFMRIREEAIEKEHSTAFGLTYTPKDMFDESVQNQLKLNRKRAAMAKALNRILELKQMLAGKTATIKTRQVDPISGKRFVKETQVNLDAPVSLDSDETLRTQYQRELERVSEEFGEALDTPTQREMPPRTIETGPQVQTPAQIETAFRETFGDRAGDAEFGRKLPFDFYEDARRYYTKGQYQNMVEGRTRPSYNSIAATWDYGTLRIPEGESMAVLAKHDANMKEAQATINQWAKRIGVKPPKVMTSRDLLTPTIPVKGMNKKISVFDYFYLSGNIQQVGGFALPFTGAQSEADTGLHLLRNLNRFQRYNGVIYIDPSLSLDNASASMVDNIIAHEYGHIVLSDTIQTLIDQDTGVIDNLLASYQNWVDSHLADNSQLKDVLASKTAPDQEAFRDMLFGATSLYRINEIDTDQSRYYLGFQEWFADNVAIWLNEQERTQPDAPVDAFFKTQVDNIKQLFGLIQDATPSQVDRSVADYMHHLFNHRQFYSESSRLSIAGIDAVLLNEDTIEADYSDDVIPNNDPDHKEAKEVKKVLNDYFNPNETDGDASLPAQFNRSVTIAQRLVDEWSEKLGITAPTVLPYEDVMTIEVKPGLTVYDHFFKDQKRNGTAISSTNDFVLQLLGATEQNPLVGTPGLIAINPNSRDFDFSSNGLRWYELLAHEFGHLVLNDTITVQAAENPEIVDQLAEEFNAWRKANGQPEVLVHQVLGSVYPAAMTNRHLGQVPDTMTMGELTEKKLEYLLSFREWFANQTARWLSSDEVAETALQKLFHKMADMVKQLYDALFKNTDTEFQPYPSVEAYYQSLMKQRDDIYL